MLRARLTGAWATAPRWSGAASISAVAAPSTQRRGAASAAALATAAAALAHRHATTRQAADLAALKAFLEQEHIDGYTPPVPSVTDGTPNAAAGRPRPAAASPSPPSPPPAMDGPTAAAIMALVAQAKPAASAPAVAAVVAWAKDPANAAAVDGAALAKIAQGCVAVNPPGAFDVLCALLWRANALAPAMDAAAAAAVLNAYGRAGVRHARLLASLGARAAALFARPESPPSLAQLANVSHALARVEFATAVAPLAAAGDADAAAATRLPGILADSAVTLGAKAPALVVATVLDAFAAFPPEAFGTPARRDAALAALEARAVAVLAECPPPLVASILASVAKAQRGAASEPVFAAAAARCAATAGAFDAASVAKALGAFRAAGRRDENVFGLLAERAARLTGDMRLSECRAVLDALAAFDLYDAELFPLLAARVVSVTRRRAPYAFDDVAGALAAFAAVQERSDDLLHALAPVVRHHAPTMSGWAVATLLWAYASLGVQASADVVAEVAAVAPGRVSAADIAELGAVRWAAVVAAHPTLASVGAAPAKI